MGKNLMATKLLSGNNTKALVTLAVGGLHTSMLELTKPTWLKYAAKHGYDIVVFDDLVAPPAETESRKIHWQKCLILEHEDVCGYEDVVWLDTDVMINYHVAPCIVSHNNADKIGLVSNWGTHAIGACLLALLDKPELLHSEELEARILERAAESGYIDAASNLCEPAVDGLPLDVHTSFVKLLATIVRKGLTGWV